MSGAVGSANGWAVSAEPNNDRANGRISGCVTADGGLHSGRVQVGDLPKWRGKS